MLSPCCGRLSGEHFDAGLVNRRMPTDLPAPNCNPATPATNPWDIVAYEAWMLDRLRTLRRDVKPKFQIGEEHPGQEYAQVISNALVESTVLHLRQLCDILLSNGRNDDITINRILSGFNCQAIDDLCSVYGHGPGSFKERLNKHCFHASDRRSAMHNYEPVFQAVIPRVEAVLAEVHSDLRRRSISTSTAGSD